jgi:hypothetical protein
MFENRLLQHLEEENKWLRGQVEELQQKLFKAVRLNLDALEPQKPMRYDDARKDFVEMTPEQVHAETVGLQELLSQNV